MGNLGLTYRYINLFDKALAAYKKSLSISPKGSLPLQNIPVVYEHMKKIQKVLDAYNNLTKLQPDKPERYFGKGRILLAHINKKKAALHNIYQAYNIYMRTNNPYRADAEKIMNFIWHDMKRKKKSNEEFNRILSQYKIEVRFAD